MLSSGPPCCASAIKLECDWSAGRFEDASGAAAVSGLRRRPGRFGLRRRRVAHWQTLHVHPLGQFLLPLGIFLLPFGQFLLPLRSVFYTPPVSFCSPSSPPIGQFFILPWSVFTPPSSPPPNATFILSPLPTL